MGVGVEESLGCQRRHNEASASIVDIQPSDAMKAEHRGTKKHVGLLVVAR